MKCLLIAVVVLFAANCAAAGSRAAATLRSAVDLNVSATADAGTYQVDAVIKDLADDAVIASPMLLVRAGEEGSIQLDRADMGTLVLSVRMDSAEHRISYRSELRLDNELLSRQSAQIALP